MLVVLQFTILTVRQVRELNVHTLQTTWELTSDIIGIPWANLGLIAVVHHSNHLHVQLLMHRMGDFTPSDSPKITFVLLLFLFCRLGLEWKKLYSSQQRMENGTVFQYCNIHDSFASHLPSPVPPSPPTSSSSSPPPPTPPPSFLPHFFSPKHSFNHSCSCTCIAYDQHWSYLCT